MIQIHARIMQIDLKAVYEFVNTKSAENPNLQKIRAVRRSRHAPSRLQKLDHVPVVDSRIRKHSAS